MKTISVKLPAPLAEQLCREAQQSERSQSEIIREALQAKFAAGGTGQVSMADALADLKGVVSGPRDLATNAKHLQGFGQ